MTTTEYSKPSRRRWVMFIMCFAGLGGLLYGYDIGVISGALVFMKKEIQLTPQHLAYIVGAVLGGGSIATLISGPLADRFGRKKMIIIAAVIFSAGVLLLIFSGSYAMVLSSRLILGVGIGIITIVVPLYLSESAPASIRGRSVTMFQLFLTGGILLAYVVDMAFTPSGNWRGMVGCVLVPGIALLLGAFVLPESPCWLYLQGRRDEALAVMMKCRSREDAERELMEMDKLRASDLTPGAGAPRVSIWKPHIMIPMVMALAIAVLNQFTGINVLLQYAPLLIEDTGLDSNVMAMLGTTGIGLMNFIMTIVALSLIDRLGRKPLLCVGTAGVVIALVTAGFVEFAMASGAAKGYALVGAMIVYIMFFAIGPGVVVWLALSELLPTVVRGKWMAVCLFANSAASWFLASFFEDFIGKIGYAGTFWMLAGATLLYFLIALIPLPETKGKSLEEIETFFLNKTGGR